MIVTVWDKILVIFKCLYHDLSFYNTYYWQFTNNIKKKRLEANQGKKIDRYISLNFQCLSYGNAQYYQSLFERWKFSQYVPVVIRPI